MLEISGIGLSLLRFLLVIGVGLLIGKITRIILENILIKQLSKRRINEFLDKVGITKEVFSIIIVTVEYSIYLLTIVLAFDIIGISIAKDIFLELWNYIPNIVAALIVIIFGLMVSDILGKAVSFSLSSTGIDELFSDLGVVPSRLAGLFVQYSISLLAIVVGLMHLGFKIGIVANLTIAFIILITFFILLMFYQSVKEFLPEFFAGFIIRNSKYIKVGQFVKINNKKYRILAIGMITTTLASNKTRMKIRNSKLLDMVEIVGE